MTTTTPTETPTLAAQQAAGLRALANLIEDNPELAEDISYTLGTSLLGMPMFSQDVDDQRARLAEWVRAGKAHGATITKDARDTDFTVYLDFGAVKLRILVDRAEVCERVVTGIETVTRKVKDPALLAAVPEVEVTEEVQTVEWRCAPILRDTTEDAEQVTETTGATR